MKSRVCSSKNGLVIEVGAKEDTIYISNITSIYYNIVNGLYSPNFLVCSSKSLDNKLYCLFHKNQMLKLMKGPHMTFMISNSKAPFDIILLAAHITLVKSSYMNSPYMIYEAPFTSVVLPAHITMNSFIHSPFLQSSLQTSQFFETLIFSSQFSTF